MRIDIDEYLRVDFRNNKESDPFEIFKELPVDIKRKKFQTEGGEEVFALRLTCGGNMRVFYKAVTKFTKKKHRYEYRSFRENGWYLEKFKIGEKYEPNCV